MLGSEFVRLEQREQPGRSQALDTIEVYHHDSGNGQLRDQRDGQFPRGRPVDLTYHRDHAGIGSTLDHPQTDVRGEITAHIHALHDIEQVTE